MAIIVCVVAQKGGVGKSAIARTLATIYVKADWEAKIADLDVSQTTCTDWNNRRIRNNILPEIAVQQYPRVTSVLKDAQHLDLMILDALPHSSPFYRKIKNYTRFRLILICRGRGPALDGKMCPSPYKPMPSICTL